MYEYNLYLNGRTNLDHGPFLYTISIYTYLGKEFLIYLSMQITPSSFYHSTFKWTHNMKCYTQMNTVSLNEHMQL